MTPRRISLLFTALFTLLFVSLIALGSYLLSVGSRQFGVAAFLFAFAAAFGQVAALAFHIRHVARDRAAQIPPRQPEKPGSSS